MRVVNADPAELANLDGSVDEFWRKLGDKIALTAWTQLATCTRFDEKAFSAFRDAFRGKGPERFPVSSLKPGT